MYIEQGYKGTGGLWKYLILPLGFIGLMAINYIATGNSQIDVEASMQQMIEQLGSNTVFVILLIPLVVGFFMVLGWTLLIQGQSILSLTTSRKRVDWKRILFSFGFWALVTIAFTGGTIIFNPRISKGNLTFKNFLSLVVIAILLWPFKPVLKNTCSENI